MVSLSGSFSGRSVTKARSSTACLNSRLLSSSTSGLPAERTRARITANTIRMMKYSNPPLLKILPKAAFAFRKMTLGHDDYTTCTPPPWAPDHGTASAPYLSGFREDLRLQHADVR